MTVPENTGPRADLDESVMNLIECFMPIEAADDSELRSIIQYAGWFTDKETRNRYSNMAKQEIILRSERKANAPAFAFGDKVRITEEMKWWPCASAITPHIGLEGTVMASRMADNDRYLGKNHKPEDFDGLIPVRFLSTDVGYEWDEETGDADRKYVTYNVPNYVLEKIT